MRLYKRSLTVLLAGMTIAISTSFSFPLEAAPNNRSQPSVVATLAGLFKKKVRSGGTRSDAICVLTPGLGGEGNLWSDRPVIVWQGGKVARVQVRLVGSKTLVWEQTLPTLETSVTYSGKPLQPEQLYEVVLLNDQSKELLREGFLPQFVPLNVAAHNRVSQALTVKHQLNNKQETVEEVVAAKVQYLLEENLISDAFQLLYTTKRASPALQELTQQIVAIACGDEAWSASGN